MNMVITNLILLGIGFVLCMLTDELIKIRKIMEGRDNE